MDEKVDIVIVGCGVAGLFAALHLPKDKKIFMITKADAKSSDSFLAQGGISVMRDKGDYLDYYEDTMKAGHYKNRPESVRVMIKSSRNIIEDLLHYGVNFDKGETDFQYTKEGAHSRARILYHKDITGQEITGKLLEAVLKQSNITLLEYTTMIDLIVEANQCMGIVAQSAQDEVKIYADYTILASGGIGGTYQHSTNYAHLTGDALNVCEQYGIKLVDMNYVQIHPTTLYSKKPGRRFLISESVRGEGAILYDKHMQRFVNELLPRDVVTKAIQQVMQRDHTDFVWLSLKHIRSDVILKHFPNIYQRCLEEGYDITKECIPVVPAQHYFMGGIWVDMNSCTTMQNLFAVGETSCNGVHGANRLASNSLLESLVFAKRAANYIQEMIKTKHDNAVRG